MKTIVMHLAAAASVALGLAACASSMPRAERLALYEANAGEAIPRMRYFQPQGWEEIDDQHVVVSVRPTEAYLLRLSGPCLDYDNGSAVMFISNTAGYVDQKFDRVSFGQPISCRIEEIRPLNVQGVRDARNAWEMANG
ncbi:MAG TPA: DUF6491 family protein [Steroidobacteraceae bacterium]